MNIKSLVKGSWASNKYITQKRVQEFRFQKINETRKYLMEEIKQNELMKKKT